MHDGGMLGRGGVKVAQYCVRGRVTVYDGDVLGPGRIRETVSIVCGLMS